MYFLQANFYLVELLGISTALADSIVVDVGLIALFGIALLSVQIGVIADHYSRDR